MTANRRILILVGVALALAIAYWMLLLSPKRAEIADLDREKATLSASLSEAEGQIDAGRAAKAGFGSDYAQLVTLGKAVPDGDEQAALMVQLNATGASTGNVFTSIALESSGAEPPAEAGGETDATIAPTATAPPSESEASADPAEEPAGETAEDPSTAAATAEPAEASVAALPIGAEVGDAELATLPYQLEYKGNFFKLADFIAGIDRMVEVDRRGRIDVGGRLLTIDGFALNPHEGEGLSELAGSFVVTSFVTPAGEGRTAGATPAGPAPDEAIPVSDTSTAP